MNEMIAPAIESPSLPLDTDGGRCDPIEITGDGGFDWDAYADLHAPQGEDGPVGEYSDHHFW